MRKHDVVYILKEGAAANELRFSLRSIEKNMVHGKVWFYCGKPDRIVPDEYVPHVQVGGSKWERVRSSLIEICKNDKISKKFWLFNDDFYVMQPMESTEPLYRGLLKDHYLDIEKRHNKRTAYANMLRICEDQLQQAGLTTLDYAVHIPILVDRAKALEALEMFPRCPMFRSLYGNYANIGGAFHKDVKTVDQNKVIPEDADFFSTSNKAFRGSVAEQMAERFPDPCKYEVEYGEGVRS